MRVSKRFVFLLSLSYVLSSGMSGSVSAQAQAKRGAVTGGLAGAAIGAIIGDNSDEAGAGAAIGGVVGAVAGTILGNANAEQYGSGPRYNAPIYSSQPTYRTQPTYAAPSNYTPIASRRVTPQDVIALSQSRVSDAIIISEIQNKGLSTPIGVQDIVFLSQQGVSDVVIQTMQNSVRPVSPVVVASPTVVVDRYPVVRSSYYYGGPYRGHRPGPPRGPSTAHRSRSGVNISVGPRR